ncbi:MAG: hypothetical protein AAGB93_23495 [Planctomycetota bacterium]
MTAPARALRAHERLFDDLLERWESPATRRLIAWVLVVAFFGSVLAIELARLGVLPTVLGRPLPTNHLAAISWVFTILLIVEVLDLVFSLAESVANALGKQLEIFSLILVRKTFDELAKLPEPIDVHGAGKVLMEMGALAGSALVVFVLLVLYYRLQRHRPISKDPRDVARFLSFKKGVCLGLLVAFAVTGAFFGLGTVTVEEAGATLSLDFFIVFYTVLVFSDVLLVLASLIVTREYRIVFRNFLFAVVTVFLRLALSADPFPKALIGVATALFALAAAWAFELSRSVTDGEDGDELRIPAEEDDV